MAQVIFLCSHGTMVTFQISDVCQTALDIWSSSKVLLPYCALNLMSEYFKFDRNSIGARVIIAFLGKPNLCRPTGCECSLVCSMLHICSHTLCVFSPQIYHSYVTLLCMLLADSFKNKQWGAFWGKLNYPSGCPVCTSPHSLMGYVYTRKFKHSQEHLKHLFNC